MPADIAALLNDAEHQGSATNQRLFEALYGELHGLAEAQLRRSGSDLTLSPTTLLHEAYLGIAGVEGVHFPDRARFMGYAARAMRRLVIDYVRHARAQKRGGGAFELTLPSEVAAGPDAESEAASLTELSDALDELAAVEPSLAEVVDLHFFCGYTFAEVARLRDVSERTVQRDWRKARMILHRALRQVPGADETA